MSRAATRPPPLSRPEPRTPVSVRDVGSALPDFGMGALALVTWLFPTLFAPKMVAWLTLVALFEFIALHSSAVLGVIAFGPTPKQKRIVRILGLALFYSLFTGAFAVAFETWWPLLSFWGLTLNRLLSVLLPSAPTQNEKTTLVKIWLTGLVVYVLTAFVTAFLPLPRLGITGEVIAAQGLPGTGLWIEEPQRAVALCFLYFTSIGLFELFALHRHITLSGEEH